MENIKGDTESRLEYYDALEKCNVEEDKSDFILLIARYVCESMKPLVAKLS